MVFGVLDIIKNPKPYFDNNVPILEKVVTVVRRAFGKPLSYENIYEHLTVPQEVCLLRDENNSIVAMRSHNRKNFSGISSLILEGAAIDPSFHGKGIYGKILSEIYQGELTICLRTQNPRVYAALEKFCSRIYPSERETPELIKRVQTDLALDLRCHIDSHGVIKGYYGGLFYAEEPYHDRITNLFKETLNMNVHNGDAVLVVGVK